MLCVRSTSRYTPLRLRFFLLSNARRRKFLGSANHARGANPRVRNAARLLSTRLLCIIWNFCNGFKVEYIDKKGTDERASEAASPKPGMADLVGLVRKIFCGKSTTCQLHYIVARF